MFNATHRPESYSAPPEDWGYGLIVRPCCHLLSPPPPSAAYTTHGAGARSCRRAGPESCAWCCAEAPHPGAGARLAAAQGARARAWSPSPRRRHRRRSARAGPQGQGKGGDKDVHAPLTGALRCVQDAVHTALQRCSVELRPSWTLSPLRTRVCTPARFRLCLPERCSQDLGCILRPRVADRLLWAAGNCVGTYGGFDGPPGGVY